MNILGISAYYHDSAAALIQNGNIIAAAQEERFTRKKHDPNFPEHAIQYCLQEAGINLLDITDIVFYDKPLIKFERLLETYLAYTPQGLPSFIAAMPVWLKEKMFLKTELKKSLAKLGNIKTHQVPPLRFTEHHQSHAASAFFPSPFAKAAVLCLDGVGEWATTSAWQGDKHTLTPLWEIDFPHSIGLLYSAITYFCGFKVNSGEYKLMGLAPYGKPVYVDKIYQYLIDVKADGSFHLNMKYFNYAMGLTMTNNHFAQLFDGPPRKSETPISQREMDLAASIQVVTEEIVLKLVNSFYAQTENDYLCLAGGVALNCVANGRIKRESKFKDIWIQPAAGDAGGALGAALAIWHQYHQKEREINPLDSMQGAYLGPKFDKTTTETILQDKQAVFHYIESEDDLLNQVVDGLENKKVIGWFSGRMEFGPRALGARSIIGDARDTDMQTTMNVKIKYRESFRPFAPSVLAEKVEDFFELSDKSPYMLLVYNVKKQHHVNDQNNYQGLEQRKAVRSKIPAITHVDYSARIQTVHKETNPRYHRLLEKFYEKTNCPVIINTSFNVRGEPVVCTPSDAYRCFMRTEMDILVIDNFILYKQEQTNPVEPMDSWQQEFELD